MTSARLRVLLLAAAAAISALLLRSALDWGAIVEAVTAVHWAALPAAGALYVGALGARALRWSVMMRPVKPMPVGRSFMYITLGYMTNNLLPARLGEFVRAWVTGRGEHLSRSAMLAGIVLERLLDGLTITALFFVGTAVLGDDARARGGIVFTVAAVTAPLVFGGAALFLWALARRPGAALAFAAGVLAPAPAKLRGGVLSLAGKFVGGLALLNAPRDFAAAAALSFLVWGAEALVYAALAYAVPGVAVDAPVLLLCLVGVNLFVMLPGLPGGIGYFQAACMWVLTHLAAVTAPTALVYAVLLHTAQIVPAVVLGYGVMMRLGVRWHDLTHVPSIGDPTGDAPGEPPVGSRGVPAAGG